MHAALSSRRMYSRCDSRMHDSRKCPKMPTLAASSLLRFRPNPYTDVSANSAGLLSATLYDWTRKNLSRSVLELCSSRTNSAPSPTSPSFCMRSLRLESGGSW